MKPKTKKEKEVAALAAGLGLMDWRHIKSAATKDADKVCFGYPVRAGFTCGCCGASFGQTRRKYKRCPHCHVTFDKYVDKRGYTENFCEGQIDRVGGWVVERIAHVKVRHTRGKAMEIYQCEVLRRWIPYGDFVAGNAARRDLRGCAVTQSNPRSFSGDFSWYGPMEVRRPGSNLYASYYGNVYDYTPLGGYMYTFGIPEELHRRGLTASEAEPVWIAHLLMSNPHFETLYKLGSRSPLCRYFMREGRIAELDRLWPSIKIALRGGLLQRNYDTSEWVDYLGMVADAWPERLTTRSVLLPDDFSKAHDAARRAANRVRTKKEAAEYDAVLRRIRVPLSKALNITDGKFFLAVLTTVADFKTEGDTLHHCVYASGYYKREKSLILSARMIDAPDTPVETIEILLGDGCRIAQCYGDHDQFSKWHDQILDLARSGIPQIRKAVAAIA